MNRSDVYEALWCPAIQNEETIERLSLALRRIESAVVPEHHGPGQESGCTWSFFVDAKGNGLGPGPGAWPHDAVRLCQVAFSYRGPFLTALSWNDPRFMPEAPTDPLLVTQVKQIGLTLNLEYLDAWQLLAWEIPWDELKGDASMRLDSSEMPNAFNLLFYE